MSKIYSDPTANAAIGAADKELRLMRKKAAQLKALHKKGMLTEEAKEAAREQFIGIYHHLIKDIFNS